MMTGTSVPFTAAVTDATGGNVKIQRKDFLTEGLLPVIDQGQEDVAGFTNDFSHAYSGDLPVVLFGDHTRVFKYVDSPFALGADGVKVLASRTGFNAKFLYYYFLSCDIPSRGYSRHFKFLKEFDIPFFAPSEQCRIVELLDEADRLRRLRREADAKAARILPALFLKMFGDPATNPMGWPMKPLGSLADQRPEYGANASACPWEQDKPRYVRITDIRDDGNLSDKEVVSLDAVDWHRYLLQEGDVLFARSGNTVGKTYIYRSSDGLCSFAGYLIRFQFRSGAVDPWFIFGLTRTAYYRGWVESHKRVAGQPNINGQEYSSLLIPEPPLPAQQKFGMLTRNIESILVGAAEAAENLETTFSTMLQQAFSGQLTAKWRQAHMEQLLAEMEQQARLLNLPLTIEREALR